MKQFIPISLVVLVELMRVSAAAVTVRPVTDDATPNGVRRSRA